MLKKVTSLFDLFNKAKTNKAYEELIMIVANSCSGITYIHFDSAKKYLVDQAEMWGDCKGIISETNTHRLRIRDPNEKVGVLKDPSGNQIFAVDYQTTFITPTTPITLQDTHVFEQLQQLAQQTQTPVMVTEQIRHNTLRDGMRTTMYTVPVRNFQEETNARVRNTFTEILANYQEPPATPTAEA